MAQLSRFANSYALILAGLLISRIVVEDRRAKTHYIFIAFLIQEQLGKKTFVMSLRIAVKKLEKP